MFGAGSHLNGFGLNTQVWTTRRWQRTNRKILFVTQRIPSPVDAACPNDHPDVAGVGNFDPNGGQFAALFVKRDFGLLDLKTSLPRHPKCDDYQQ